MPEPAVSVVIPVRNGGERLATVLDALRAQRMGSALEIVAIDSGSTDGSPERLERAGARVERIAPEAFDHGETRNLGARIARGEHVVFLSQDARPVGDGFIDALVRPLDVPRIAGAFARQVPRPGADPRTRRDLAGWVAASPTPRVVFGPDGMDHLTPFERYQRSAFDNVASAVRRAVLLEHPFRATRFGEDVEWGSRILFRGFGIAYVPDAVVEHSHERSARELYRRNYLGHRLLYRLFALRTIPSRSHLLRAVAGTLASDLLALRSEPRSVTDWLAWPAQAVGAAWGQYRGAQDERQGRPYPSWA